MMEDRHSIAPSAMLEIYRKARKIETFPEVFITGKCYPGAWTVSCHDDEILSFPNQYDAWEFCKSLARKARGIAVRRKRDGQINLERDYTKDKNGWQTK
jgi:hypothetical protein